MKLRWVGVETRLAEIKAHPEKHKHDFNGFTSCCVVDGVFHLSIQDAHERDASFGTNGGVRCDVSSGPCSCGAWHR